MRTTERAKSRRWYQSNKDWLAVYRIKVKLELIEYKGGKCKQCGYNKDVPGAYDFHHREPKQKEFSIASSRIANMQRLFAEVDKCDLLCKNCHAELHDNAQRRQSLLEAYARRLEEFFLKEKKCGFCGKMFKPLKRRQRYCIGCGNAAKRKVQNRPTAEEIKKMRETMSWCEIGRKYGVSDNAVRKWV